MIQNLVTEDKLEVGQKAKKFVLWLFVVSSTIMFGGWTSYYIVFSSAKGKGHGLVLPDAFIYSTLILLISSVLLFISSKALKNRNRSKQQMFLWLTILFGLAFGALQFKGWVSLYNSGAVFVNNNAAISMIYVLSGIHLLHIIAGLMFLLNSLMGSYKDIGQQNALYKQSLASIFWHFIDILWIYLYVFLLLNS